MAIPKNGHSSHPRRDLLEHLQPFAAQAVFEHQEAGDIAARARQARNEADADRVDDNHESAPPSSVMNSPRFTPDAPVLSTERIAHLSYGTRLLRCGILVRPMTASRQTRSFGDVG
jgi:hypothetical protein